MIKNKLQTIVYKLRSGAARLRWWTWVGLGLILLLLPIVYFTLLNPSEAEAEWYNEGWAYRKKITIDNAQVSGSTDFTDFPIAIIETTDTDLRDNAQSDGDDIVFTDHAGKKLDHEIEKYTSANADLYAWVKIPTLLATEDTIIYMYYGNPSASNQQNPDKVWDSDFSGVYHIDDDFLDSTANNNDTTNSGSTDQTGKIADGQQMYDSDQHIYAPMSGLIHSSVGTIELWYKETNNTTGYEPFFQSSEGNDQFAFNRGNADNAVNFATNNSIWSSWVGTTVNPYDGSWHHVVLTYDTDSNSAYLYLDGASEGQDTSNHTTIDLSTYNLHIGNTDVPDAGVDGIIDEFRVSYNTLRTGDWIATSYNTQNHVSSAFYTLAGSEVGPGPVGWWGFDEGANDTCPGGSTDICDSTSSGTDLNMTGGTWQDESMCIEGKCMHFGGSAYAEIGNKVDDSTSGTVTAWVKLNSGGLTANTNYAVWAYGGGSVGTPGLLNGLVRTNSSNNGFLVRVPQRSDGGSLAQVSTTKDTFAYNTWHHIAIVSTGTAWEIYVNGQSEALTVDSGSNNGNWFGDTTVAETDTTDIGARMYDGSRSLHFEGFIDEVKIYPYARSAAQIKADYAGGGQVFGNKTDWLSDGLVGYWKMDETSGNASDSSGNATTLTNNGTTTFVTGKFANGSEHVPASSQHFSTATTISGVQSVSFWTNPDSNTNYYLSLTASDYITSSSGTISVTGFGSNEKIFVDGVESTTIAADSWQLVTVTTDTAISASQIYVGRQGSNYYDGTMDEVRFYNRALSPTEVADLYEWAPGPVLHYKFDENTGTSTVIDSSSNAKNGTMNGSMTADDWVPGRYGSALDFDGSDDNVSLADDNDLDFVAADGFTVEAWAKHDTISTSIDHIVNKAGPNTGGYKLYMDDSGDFCFVTDDDTSWDTDDSACTSGVDYDDNAWHHVVGTKDGTSSLELFVDGVSVASDTSIVDTNTIENANALYVGVDRDGTTDDWAGQIDDVRIYRYVRTPQQIVEDMNAGHPAPGSPIGSQVAYWGFDEQGGQNVYDYVGSNDGTRGADTGSSTDDPTWKTQSDCKLNGCLSFDGGDYVDMDTDTALNISDKISITAWINPSQLSNETIVCKGVSAAEPDYNFNAGYTGSGTNNLAFDDGTAWRVSNDNVVTTSAWQHVAVTYDSSATTFYVDGIQVGTDSATTLQTGANAAYVGTQCAVAGNKFTGSIDEVKIYNDVLTADQILLDMNAGGATNFGAGYVEADDLTDTAGNPPVGHWSFDDNTGTGADVAKDTSENENHGDTGGSMTEGDWVPGKHGSALDFDGSDDRVNMGNPSTFNFGTAVTFEAWVYPTGFPNGSNIIINKWASGVEDKEFGVNSSGTVYIYLHNTGSTLSSATNISLNEWTHIAVVYDGSATTKTIYFNGVYNNSNSSSGDIADSTGNLYVGGNPDDGTVGSFQGKIDEVKIYDYARTPAQVAYDYNRGAPVGWWDFDECQGTTANDASGNGNDGTWSGSGGTNTSAGTCSSGAGNEAWDNGTTGKRNASLDFDSTDDIVTVTNADEIDQNVALVNGVTFSTWIYANSDGETDLGEIFSKNTNTWCRTDSESAGKLDLECSLDLATPATLNVSSALNINTWHHVTVGWTDDGDDELTLWVDGVNMGSSSDGVGAPVADTANLIIGGTPNFDGQIDDFRIYTYELSAAQIKKIMQDGSHGGTARFGPDTGSP